MPRGILSRLSDSHLLPPTLLSAGRTQKVGPIQVIAQERLKNYANVGIITWILFESELPQSRSGTGNISACTGAGSSRCAWSTIHPKRACSRLPPGEAPTLRKGVPRGARNYAASCQAAGDWLKSVHTDLRDADACAMAHRHRNFWGKLYTDIRILDNDHVVLVSRPASHPR